MRILGLDVGVTSVGWALVDLDDSDNSDKKNNKIVQCGVRLFDSVAMDKAGNLQSQVWSASKSSRRRFRRKRERLNEIIKIFKDINFIDSKFNKNSFFDNFHKNIYVIRAKALTEKIQKDELFACIYHIAKHRGYRSGTISDDEKKNKDKEGTKKTIKETKSNMNEGETFAQYLVRKAQNSESKEYAQYRNRKDVVNAMANKEMMEFEARKILETQSKFYSELDSVLIEEIIKTINKKEEAINKEALSKMLGKCQFEENEYRTSSRTFSVIRSHLLQKINNITLIDINLQKDNTSSLITQDSTDSITLINRLENKFFSNCNCKLTYADVREIANIDDNIRFKGIDYRNAIFKEIYRIFLKQKTKSEEGENKKDSKNKNSTKFAPYSKALYALVEKEKNLDEFSNIIDEYLKEENRLNEKEALFKSFSKLSFKSIEQNSEVFKSDNLKSALQALEIKNFEEILNKRDFIDNVVLILFFNKDEETINQELQKLDINETMCEKLINCVISGTSNLSLKAIKNIEPFLLKGYKYINACERAGYDKEKSTKRFKKLPLMKQAMEQGLVGVNNPRVRKINNQAIKLINELISRKMYFDRINIELARDIPKTKQERKQEKNSNDEVNKLKENAKAIVGENATQKEIMKARLFVLQDKSCPYCGEKLYSENIKGEDYQIDHIKPFSRSFDNSFSNKVLVHYKCNQEKGDRLPLEWLSGDEAEKYKARINSSFKHLPKSKINNLLLTEISDTENPRILTETRYATRFLKNYIEKHLDFESFSPESNLKKSSEDARFQRVQTRNGSVTSILRNIWHIGEQDKSNQTESIERYKKDRNIHTHHAEDAIILAFSSQALVKRIHDKAQKIATKFNKKTNEPESLDLSTGEISNETNKHAVIEKEMKRIYHESAPLIDMPNQVKMAISNVFPSRMVTRLNKFGKIHDDTIFSVRDKSRNYKRVDKEELKRLIDEKNTGNLIIVKNQSINSANSESAKNNLKKMLGKDDRNKNMYEAIKAYLDVGDFSKKCMYKNVEIKSFKFEGDFNVNAINVRNGVADKSTQEKYLVYKKDGYFWIGVVFMGDNIKDDKTARVKIVDGSKDHINRDYSDQGYEYQMTLYKNDLIYYRQAKGKDSVEKIYYVSDFNIASNASMFFLDPLVVAVNKVKKEKETIKIEAKEPHISIKFGKLSRNNILEIKRLEVDMLGNVYKIENGEKINFTKEALRIIKQQKDEMLRKANEKLKEEND